MIMEIVEIKHLIEHWSHETLCHHVFYLLFCATPILVFFNFCSFSGVLFYLYKSKSWQSFYTIFSYRVVCSVWANDCFRYCSWRGFVGGLCAEGWRAPERLNPIAIPLWWREGNLHGYTDVKTSGCVCSLERLYCSLLSFCSRLLFP